VTIFKTSLACQVSSALQCKQEIWLVVGNVINSQSQLVLCTRNYLPSGSVQWVSDWVKRPCQQLKSYGQSNGSKPSCSRMVRNGEWSRRVFETDQLHGGNSNPHRRAWPCHLRGKLTSLTTRPRRLLVRWKESLVNYGGIYSGQQHYQIHNTHTIC
jgi:hypothetical protein